MPKYILKDIGTQRFYVQKNFVAGFLTDDITVATVVESAQLGTVIVALRDSGHSIERIEYMPYYDPNLYAALVNTRSALQLAREYLHTANKLDVFKHTGNELTVVGSHLLDSEIILTREINTYKSK